MANSHGEQNVKDSVVGTTEKYILRMPDGMRDRIRLRAEANRRSMNSEIVHYLDRALAAENKNGPAATAIAPDLEQDQPR